MIWPGPFYRISRAGTSQKRPPTVTPHGGRLAAFSSLLFQSRAPQMRIFSPARPARRAEGSRGRIRSFTTSRG
eukprot:9193986-Alexandrium_andersonii.AAC.1